MVYNFSLGSETPITLHRDNNTLIQNAQLRRKTILEPMNVDEERNLPDVWDLQALGKDPSQLNTALPAKRKKTTDYHKALLSCHERQLHRLSKAYDIDFGNGQLIQCSQPGMPL